MKNQGVLLLFGLCCVWPLIVHGAIVWIGKGAALRDWSKINWDALKFWKGDK